ncbi:MAG TPA: MFS transporter [Stellaceae bacterium]|nr:MFS transporter [Stellaceae bacterium]
MRGSDRQRVRGQFIARLHEAILVRAKAEKSAFAESFDLFLTRRFGTFTAASLLSNLGTWAQQVAEPWLLLGLGASPFLIGLDSFAMAAPVWALTVLGGILADRTDRRRLIAACQTVQMLCPACLVVLIMTGAVQPWMVIGLSVVVGVTDALSMPAFQTIVPSIVEPRQIPTALALNATQFNLSRIIGPAIAGILMATLGAVGCFELNTASYLPFIWVALWILPRGPRPKPRDEVPDERLFAGIREVTQSPYLRGALATVLLTGVFCGPLIVFCPVLVKAALHGDASDFSIAIGAFGVGGLCGAIALLGIPTDRDRRRMTTYLAIGYGALVVMASLVPWLSGLPVLLALAGMAMTISNTSANTLLQSATPPELRGQTVSLYMLAIRGGASFGALITGATVGLFGVREALLVNGILAIAAQVALAAHWFRAPSVR